MDLNFLPALRAEELAPNSSRAVTLNGQSILVCNADGEFHAVENLCSHQASPLEGGRVRRCTIICPLHGMPFDLRTGAPKGQLTDKPIRTFPVRTVDGMVEIAV